MKFEPKKSPVQIDSVWRKRINEQVKKEKEARKRAQRQIQGLMHHDGS